MFSSFLKFGRAMSPSCCMILSLFPWLLVRVIRVWLLSIHNSAHCTAPALRSCGCQLGCSRAPATERHKSPSRAGLSPTLHSQFPRAAKRANSLSFSWMMLLRAQHIHTLPNTCLCNKDDIPLPYFILIHTNFQTCINPLT